MHLDRNVNNPNMQMMQTRMNAAHGGNIHKNHMEEAHFNKDELMAMDLVQGGRIRDPHTGLPTYNKLAHILLNHPEQQEHLEHLIELGHLHNAGHETHLSDALREAAEHGRFGDTEIAKIPHSLSNMLDHMIGGPSYNEDGRKEYFFGALLGLAARAIPTIVGAVGRAAPAFARIAPRIASAASRGAANGVTNIVKMASHATPLLRNAGTAASTLVQKAVPVIRNAVSSPIGKQIMSEARNVGNQVAQGAGAQIASQMFPLGQPAQPQVQEQMPQDNTQTDQYSNYGNNGDQASDPYQNYGY